MEIGFLKNINLNKMARMYRTNQELMDALYKGDERCLIPIGAIVVKANSEEGDYTKDGTLGKVVGNIYVEEENRSGYLVEFSGNEFPLFVVEYATDPLKPRLKQIL